MLCVFFKQKTAYEMRISDWSSDVCSSDLALALQRPDQGGGDSDPRRGGDHHLPRSAGEGEQIELALLAIDQAGKEKAPRRAADEDVAIESGGKIIWRKTIQPEHDGGTVHLNAGGDRKQRVKGKRWTRRVEDGW